MILDNKIKKLHDTFNYLKKIYFFSYKSPTIYNPKNKFRQNIVTIDKTYTTCP